MTLKEWWLPVAFIILFFSRSLAQNRATDSISNGNPADRAIAFYNQIIAEQSEIYNGAFYQTPSKATKGSVYFQDKSNFTASDIRYNNRWYKNVPVLYDVFNDVMVAQSPNLFNYILQTDKLSDVYLINHHFVYVAGEPGG
ncbi:MAG: hypothetical protein M3N14_00490, partial [Bacteroidota bacterium]|nr:hypothetical protein [Bacteroidota bacterium]